MAEGGPHRPPECLPPRRLVPQYGEGVSIASVEERRAASGGDTPPHQQHPIDCAFQAQVTEREFLARIPSLGA
jgi:hypothetical protein